MKNYPFVSIVIPVYNAENFIHETINSVLNQNYNNYNVILIDNNSTDKSFSILKLIIKKYRHLKLIHEKKQGISYALNKGIKKSSGDIICFLDQDDIYLPNRIKNMVNLLQKTNSDYVACRGYKIDTNGNVFGETSKYCESNDTLKIKLLQDNQVSSLSYFTIKKDTLLKYYPLAKKFQNMLDYFLLLNLMKNNHKTVFSNELLVKRRYHEKNVSKNMDQKAKQIIPLMIDYYNSCKNIKLFYNIKTLKKLITKRYIDALQFMRRNNSLKNIEKYLIDYVNKGYILKEFYVYFVGFYLYQNNSLKLKTFISKNEINHPFYYYIKGLMFYNEKKYKKSSEFFNKSFKLSKNKFVEALNSKAISDYFFDKKESIKTMEKVINLNHDFLDAFNNLDYIYNNDFKMFKHSFISPQTINYFLKIY